MKKRTPQRFSQCPLLGTILVLSTFLAQSLHALPQAPIDLWPAGTPENVEFERSEFDQTKPEDDLVDGRYVTRLTNVTNPTLTFYPAPLSENAGPTVLVCPGGGYWILAYDLEGSEICEWLNSIGVNAALLKYRVPLREGRQRFEAPLEDAARAMQIIRLRAKKWNIDPDKVGVLGFSAGGHLSATLSNTASMPTIEEHEAVNGIKIRPDFAVLIYPAYLTIEEENDAIRPEVKPTVNTPPTFISIAMDDPVRVEGAMSYALALKNFEVATELHIYPTGGHGYGLRRTQNPVTTWPDRVEDWMRSSGFLE